MIRQLAFIAWGAVSTTPLAAPLHTGIDHRLIVHAKLLAGISKHENCPLPLTPTCLSFAHQPGARRTANGYAAFPNAAMRLRASQADLAAKLDRGMSVAEIVGKYNRAYLATLLRETGLKGEERGR